MDGDGGCCGWAINTSNEPIAKADVFLYNCNIILCSPSSGKMYSIEKFPLYQV